MPDTQWMERTRLARERSMLAIVVIAALLVAHGRDAFSVVAGLLVAAIGLWAREPRHLAFAALLAAACAAVSLALH
jgi:Na+-translocating ferredoxin:NAD+ oxidoreductase RnfD subunit